MAELALELEVIHCVLELELEDKTCVLELDDDDELNRTVLDDELDDITAVEELTLDVLEDELP